MRWFWAIPVSLLTSCLASCASCSSEHSAEDLRVTLQKSQTYYDSSYRTQLRRRTGGLSSLTTGSVRLIEAVARGSVCIAVVFLLLSCLRINILEVRARRLAEANPCGEGVSQVHGAIKAFGVVV